MAYLTNVKIISEISNDNSSITPLLAGETFTGTTIDTKDIYGLSIAVRTDVASAVDGFVIQSTMVEDEWDSDKIWTDTYTVLAPNYSEEILISPKGRYARVVYTNATSDQTFFRLSTTKKYLPVRPTTHRIKDIPSEQDDADLVKAVLSYSDTNDGTINNVSIQNPLPTDGDSVYAKDIWEDESDLGDFSGSITDLFDNLHTEITNTTSDNPKTLIVHFNRTIISNVIGFGCYGGNNFSNVKIEIINSGPTYTTVYDDSSDNTKYTTLTCQLPITAGFNALRITFHTTDTICLSNIVIPKTRGVISRLQAAKPDNTVTDINATNGGNLKVSVEELESGISVNSNSQLKVTPYDSSGNEGIQLQDENNIAYGIKQVDNKIRTSSMSYLYDISEGNIPDHEPFTKYGRVSGIDDVAADVWFGEGGTPSDYVFPTTAQQMNISSSSLNDDGGGTGVNTLYLEGLDSDYNIIYETVTLDGTNTVTTTNSYLRVNSCRAVSVGSLGHAAGDITIKNLAGTVTYGVLPEGLTICRDLIYTVPSGKTLYLTSITVASGKGGNATNLNAVIFTPRIRLFGSDIFYPQGELLTINSETIRNLELPGVIPEKTDVKMSVKGDYASGDATCISAVRGWIE